MPARAPLAPLPSERADVVEASLANGWIHVTVLLPRGHDGQHPAVITPIVPNELLLERGIAAVRYHMNWEALAELRPPEPTPIQEGPEMHVGAWLLTAPRPGIVGRGYFSILTLDAESTVPQVIDYLRTIPQIDPERITIAGSSTSGFVALQAMAADPRIALGVVRVACGDYRTFLRLSSLGLAGDPRWLVNGEMVLDADYAAEIDRIEPIRAAARFPPRPLLLMNGVQDEAIPIDCARRTAEELRTAYARASVPERFDAVELGDQGHNLGPESERLALDWWDRWLVSPDAARRLRAPR